MRRINILFLLRSALMMVAVSALAMPVQAQGQNELQQLLDGAGTSTTTRASGDGFTEIDLSGFTDPITETLYVRNQNIRFVNGTLTQADSFKGTLVEIQNGYSLELPSSAKLQGNGAQTAGSARSFVKVTNGSLIINGGEIGGLGWLYTHPVYVNRALPIVYSDRTAIELTGGINSSFTLSSGTVGGRVLNMDGGRVTINGGTICEVRTSKDFWLSGSAYLMNVVLQEQAYFTLDSPLQHTLGISGYQLGQVVAQGYTAIPGGSYTITQSDVEKMELRDNTNNYKLELSFNGWSNGQVIVREDGIDYNNITNEDDLQAALDEIAAQRPSNPVELTINPNGITLTHAIRANAYCKANITGGNIRVGGVTSYGEALSGDDFMFLVNKDASLTFRNIAIDFCQLKLKTVFWNNGYLAILASVSYLNVVEDVVNSWGNFYFNAGLLEIVGGKLPHISGHILSNGNTWSSGSGTAFLNDGLFDQPVVYNKAGSLIIFDSTVSSQWTFEGDWENYQLETAFIMNHAGDLAASDYWQMKFVGLPSKEHHRTVYYDGSSHSVKLKTYNSLQDIMDGDDDGNVDVPCDGVDVGEDYTPAQRMQWLLDGSDCPSAEFDPPTIWLPGGCMFFPDPIAFRYITFDSFSSGHRLYIRNKTEFKDKVVARNFLVFSIIEHGGHLIWDNAETDNILYPIYNDGGIADIRGGKLVGTVYNAGTLILCGCVNVNEIQAHPQGVIRVTSPITSTWTIDLTFDNTLNYPNNYVIVEGAEGYNLTATDYSKIQLKLPAGCSAVFDATHNSVILNTTSDIHSVKAEAESSQYFTLDGKKVNGQPSKKGVYITKGRKVLVK
jgi:hypothetical protein